MAKAQLVPAWSWQLSSGGEKAKGTDMEKKKKINHCKLMSSFFPHAQPALNTTGCGTNHPGCDCHLPNIWQSSPWKTPRSFSVNIIVNLSKGMRSLTRFITPGLARGVLFGPSPKIQALPCETELPRGCWSHQGSLALSCPQAKGLPW